MSVTLPQPKSGTRRFLIRGVNWLGDAVMTTPALRQLRAAHPDAHISLLTPRKLADLWRHHPAIDDILTFESRDTVLSVARTLRQARFDVGLILPNSPRSALEVFLARIPLRVGYRTSWRRWMLTHAIPVPTREQMEKRSPSVVRELVAANPPRRRYPLQSHHVFHYLNLVQPLHASAELIPPHLEITADEVAAVRTQFGWPEASPVFGLNPGAEYGPAKRWPLEYFVDAAIALHRQLHNRWVILGGSGDRQLAEELAHRIGASISSNNVHNLAGRTTLRELCSVLKVCGLLVTNDTGPMHVAAAVGTPVVVPFGSTSPELTGPGMPGSPVHGLICGEVPCAPCFLRECPIDFRCMHSIRPETVVAMAIQIWRRHGEGR